MASKLLGYRKGTSKKGAPYCMMHILTDLTPSEKAGGSVGQKTEQIFMPETLVDMLKPEHIGKDIFLDYTISGGRAFLDNVTVK